MKNTRINLGMIVCFLYLLTIGILIVYSASYPVDLDTGKAPMSSFKRHLFFLGTGMFFAIIQLAFPIRLYRKISFLAFLVTVGMCFLTRTSLGVDLNGATRWIRLGGASSAFQIQPSDFLKIGCALYIPSVLVQRRDRGLAQAVFFIVMGVAAASILFQPDLGTTLLIVGVGMIVYFTTLMPLAMLPIIGGMVLAGGAYFATSAGYRMGRVQAWRDPYAAPGSYGWSVLQAKYAIAHGGLSGVGLSNSIQKFTYIYAANTDYIFAILIEELGLVTGFVTIAAYAYIVWTMFREAEKLQDGYYAAVIVAIASFIGLQTFIHIASVGNAIPATGIGLPFISYGGTSLLSFCVLFGIACNILLKAKRKEVVQRADHR